MKSTFCILAFVASSASCLAQQGPPFNPITNTNTIPTNAIICRFDVLTADATAPRVPRHHVIVSVRGNFALNWCRANRPHALASGTLNYALLVDGRLPSNAAFQIYGPAGKHHRVGLLFD